MRKDGFNMKIAGRSCVESCPSGYAPDAASVCRKCHRFCAKGY